MQMRDMEEVPPIVKDLAELFSVQVRYSNKIWLALIAASTLVVFPNIQDNKVVIPFGLGVVDAATYKIVGFLILVIIFISYCHAYAGAHLATRFAHSTIDKIEARKQNKALRRAFDFSIHSSLARVAHLAELISSAKAASIYYCLLKLLATLVLIGLPSFALFFAYKQISDSASIPTLAKVVLFVPLAVTGFSIYQILCIETRHSWRVGKLFWKNEIPKIDNL